MLSSHVPQNVINQFRYYLCIERKAMNYIDTFERVEHKYLMRDQQAKLFYQSIAQYIRPDIYPFYNLYNIYYDSDDYRMISHSIEGPVYKEKLRIRSYGELVNNPFIYVEMKKKYEGIVYKRRIQVPAKQMDTLFQNNSQIGKEITYMQQFYNADKKVFIAYDRHAYQAKQETDVRITFDTNIRYRLNHLELNDNYTDIPLLAPKQVLVEIKVMHRYPLWLIHTLTGMHMQRTSFSKYGTIYTNIIKGG